MKTRYSQPFTDIELRIPWDKGMDPYSGFFDLLEKKNLITKEGNRYVYVDIDGEIHKYFRKEWSRNENSIMDKVMEEFSQKQAMVAAPSEPQEIEEME
jgi:hypothetical protein